MENTANDTRVADAIRYFEEGYNCAQAVVLAFADRYHLEQTTAAAIATSFGGGIGRMREVCGAVSGAAMVLGMEYPHLNPAVPEAKNENYLHVQNLLRQFRSEMGSFICADLLRAGRGDDAPVSAVRNKEYYSLRPCTRCVAVAANLAAAQLKSEPDISTNSNNISFDNKL